MYKRWCQYILEFLEKVLFGKRDKCFHPFFTEGSMVYIGHNFYPSFSFRAGSEYFSRAQAGRIVFAEYKYYGITFEQRKTFADGIRLKISGGIYEEKFLYFRILPSDLGDDGSSDGICEDVYLWIGVSADFPRMFEDKGKGFAKVGFPEKGRYERVVHTNNGVMVFLLYMRGDGKIFPFVSVQSSVHSRDYQDDDWTIALVNGNIQRKTYHMIMMTFLP